MTNRNSSREIPCNGVLRQVVFVCIVLQMEQLVIVVSTNILRNTPQIRSGRAENSTRRDLKGIWTACSFKLSIAALAFLLYSRQKRIKARVVSMKFMIDCARAEQAMAWAGTAEQGGPEGHL